MTEAVKFVVSVGLNFILLSVCLFLLQHRRKFSKPYDPKVSVYAQKGARHGWLTSTATGARVPFLLSCRPADAAVAPLSEMRGLINEMVRARFYVKVVRVVHRERWMDADTESELKGKEDGDA